MAANLSALFGDIDIYLFDQLLKGRYSNCTTVVDIGCGRGRNLHFFLSNGFDVYGFDRNEEAVLEVQALSAALAPELPLSHFVQGSVEHPPFPAASFDLAICNAVLHFADNEAHFRQMLFAAWGLVKPGGYFFARLASDIGIEEFVFPMIDGRSLLPDGSERYLVSHEQLLLLTEELGAQMHEPIKTTNVHNERCMTTWCLYKPA